MFSMHSAIRSVASSKSGFLRLESAMPEDKPNPALDTAPAPILVRIAAHRTPHSSDPPDDAHEFYAALGMFAVAWGQFEGHMTACILQIKNLPEALAEPPQAPPITWQLKAKFWNDAFKSFPSLAPQKDAALKFMSRIMVKLKDRHFSAHATWDEFVVGAPEPTVQARKITPRKGTPDIVEITDIPVSITMLRNALTPANNPNFELCRFSSFLDSLRLPPPTVRRL